MINQQKSYKYFYRKFTDMILTRKRLCKYFYKKITENYKSKNIFTESLQKIIKVKIFFSRKFTEMINLRNIV